MKIKVIKTNKGFTLVELLIAMSITSIIAMSFFTILNSTIKSNFKNERFIKCTNIAQTDVESIRQQIQSIDKNQDKTPSKVPNEIKVESSDSYEGKVIEVGENNFLEKGLPNDENIYYEKVNVNKKIVSKENSNYLYTIIVRVHYNKKDFESNKGREFTTQVFSKTDLEKMGEEN